MNSVMQISEMVVLVPLAAAQAGIVFCLWLYLRDRLSPVGANFYWGAVASLAVVGLCGIVLGSTVQYAPHFMVLRTITYLWLLPCCPAFALYLAYRSASARWDREPVSESRRKLLRSAGVAAIAGPFAVEAWGGIITRVDFKVEEVDFPVAGLHPDLAGLRILQISDVHLSRFLSERDFARVVDAANELRPQIALMTGDLISSRGDPLDACIAQLSRIKADAPLLGCLGNHEIYAQAEAYTKARAARYGMTFLRSERRELKFGPGVLNIAGIDYQSSKVRGHYLAHTSKLIAPGATNLLLSHNPDVFREAPEQGWQAMLAGHTHGGQVTFEILKQSMNVARFFTPYVSGLYVERGSACYVTRGIGTIGIPARVGATPEITLLRLRLA